MEPAVRANDLNPERCSGNTVTSKSGNVSAYGCKDWNGALWRVIDSITESDTIMYLRDFLRISTVKIKGVDYLARTGCEYRQGKGQDECGFCNAIAGGRVRYCNNPAKIKRHLGVEPFDKISKSEERGE